MTRMEKLNRFYELREFLKTCKEAFHANPTPDNEKRFYEQIKKLDDFEHNELIGI